MDIKEYLMKKLFSIISLAVPACLWICACNSASAQIKILPLLDLEGQYDDNVRFSRSNKVSDYVGIVGPGATIKWTKERSRVDASAIVDVFRYAQNPDLNVTNQYYNMNGDYKVDERTSIRAFASYVKDTTLNSELEETGIVLFRQNRERFSLGGGILYQISEVSNVAIDYEYSDITYDSSFFVDYDYNSVVLSYNQRLKNQMDVFTVQPFFYNYQSEVSTVETSGLSFGYNHLFSKTFQFIGFLGVRYTEIEFRTTVPILQINPAGTISVQSRQFDQSQSDWNVVANLMLTRIGETTSGSVGYRRELGYSGSGEPINVDRLFVSLERKLTERFWGAFSATIYSSDSAGGPDIFDNLYFSLDPSLSYKLTKDHELRLSYSYQRSFDRESVRDSTAERNRVWLSLSLRWPKGLETWK